MVPSLTGLWSLHRAGLLAAGRLTGLDCLAGPAGGGGRSPGQPVQGLSLGLGLLSLQLELHLQLLQLGGGGARHSPHSAQLGEELGDGVDWVPGCRGEGGQGGGPAGAGGGIVMAAGPVRAQSSSTVSNTSVTTQSDTSLSPLHST